MPILMTQHADVGNAGRLGMTLRDHGHRLDVRRLDQGDGLPSNLDDHHAVVLLGGPQNVDEPSPWMPRVMDLIREAHERALPVVGVCLGAQMIAHALGGTVRRMSEPEFGFHDLALTGVAQTDTIMAGVPWRHPQLHLHTREIASAPPGATILASTERTPIQAFRVGVRTYAFQFHFECDRDHALALSRDTTPEHADAIMADFDARYDMYARVSNRLCVNLVTYAIVSTILT